MNRTAALSLALAAFFQSSLSTVDLPTNLRVRGELIPSSIAYPDSSIVNADVAASAAIAASKLEAQASARYYQAAGVNVATQTAPIHIARGSGSIVSFEVVPVAVPTGDYTYTVDLQRSTAAGAYASVLTGVVTVNSSSVARTVVSGALSSTTLTDADTFQVVVTAAGTTGTQGQGFACVLTTREAP